MQSQTIFDMHERELEMWWSSLPISQKERLARKGQKRPGKEVNEDMVRYPACTVWWISLDTERQLKIHDHCVDKHGYLLPEWNDADPYGD